ncbi:alpha/beta fold hydrolase [Actinoplanes sp. NBRC 101535]|uniref:alpha/beta fold hydrolase n=1 Tax=Actinoplanes sp. NBRC 101535 TaxID=3032196 RepID=UPI0024A57A7E|nr:alpha/beta fold hydrolase [Actinoplanes sp. NBRC 101535]GLY04516.1 carboxylesterase [Actinoplanes sp. NBRC 101535]
MEPYGRFVSDTARRAFLAAYDRALLAWPEPRTSWDLETRFGSVHVHRYGPADGTPIVLLHGAAGNATNWYPHVAALGVHHQVFALDTLDEPNRSVARQALTGPDQTASWLDETLGLLGLDAVHLVGFSYGGYLALNQAVHGPDRLRRVTVIDPGGLATVPARFYLSMLAGAFAMILPRRWHPWLSRALAQRALLEPPDQLALIKAAATSFRTRRPAARRLTDDELRSIRVPVRVLLAGRSVLLDPQRTLARVHALIPDVRAAIVPGAGHGLPLEQPGLVTARILADD